MRRSGSRAEGQRLELGRAERHTPDAPAPGIAMHRLASELAGRHDPETTALARAIRRLSAGTWPALRGEPVGLGTLRPLADAEPRRLDAVAGRRSRLPEQRPATWPRSWRPRPASRRGPGDGALLGCEELASLELSVTGEPETLADARWTLDGRDVTANVEARGRPRGPSSKLADGTYEVDVRAGGVLLWSASHALLELHHGRDPYSPAALCRRRSGTGCGGQVTGATGATGRILSPSSLGRLVRASLRICR